MPAKRTGIVLDPECLAHDPGPGHPESPQRLQTILSLLATRRLRELPLVLLSGRQATEAEVLRVHTDSYFRRLKATAGLHVKLDPDTLAGPRSFEIAMKAAGCTLAAVEAVVKGEVDNAFALVRPPGHHAEPDRAMGFCLLNNVAIAARHAREALGLQRVAIIDFDVHHGNGTQAAFWRDPSVLFVSTHQSPLYPGSGTATEVGEGLGEGRTLNLPLGPGHGDAEYDAIYGGLIARVLEKFRPELILVSAGFDISVSDPLGSMTVTYEGFARIAAHLVNAADLLCKGRLMMVLEGGYSVEGLEDGVSACLEALTGTVTVDDPVGAMIRLPLGDAKEHLELVYEYWDI